MKLLENKVALITGGSRGIGANMVEIFAQHGAHVAFTYRSSKESAERIAEQAAQYGTTVKAYTSDASSFADTQTLVTEVIKEFGKVDILVNNAGITRDNLLMRMSEDQWDEIMNNNLKSVYNFTKAIMRPMLKARGGSIINISSIVGLIGNAGQANYAAAKAGMIGFTKSIAKEVGSRNIRCNAIAPGFITTSMTEDLDEKIQTNMKQATSLQRFGTPEEISNAAVFLASDLSSYVTGETLSVTGGM